MNAVKKSFLISEILEESKTFKEISKKSPFHPSITTHHITRTEQHQPISATTKASTPYITTATTSTLELTTTSETIQISDISSDSKTIKSSPFTANNSFINIRKKWNLKDDELVDERKYKNFPNINFTNNDNKKEHNKIDITNINNINKQKINSNNNKSHTNANIPHNIHNNKSNKIDLANLPSFHIYHPSFPPPHSHPSFLPNPFYRNLSLPFLNNTPACHYYHRFYNPLSPNHHSPNHFYPYHNHPFPPIRKRRILFNQLQIQQLQRIFKRQKYLSASERDQISSLIGLSPTQVHKHTVCLVKRQ